MIPLDDLSSEWRTRSNGLRRYGAVEVSATLEACADELEERAREWENEALSLEVAAEESGYARDHLGKLIRDGTLPNAGEPYAPRIRRRDLPRKPGHSPNPKTKVDTPVPFKVQMARSVVESE